MGHNHNHGDLRGRNLGISIVLNIVITVAQAIGGLISGSLSLLADALHNFSDVIALIISYIADKLTKRKYTKTETFGYKRAEVIAALINASSLIVIAVFLAKEAIIRFGDPVEIDSIYVIILAFLSIAVNGGCVLLLQADAENNMNMRSAYLHLLSDMITSCAVLAGGVAMHFFNIFWIDNILSILISFYLIYSAFGLLKQTLAVLMQFTPAHIDVDEVKTSLEKFKRVAKAYHIHIWQLNDQDIHFEAHLDLKDDLPVSKTSPLINDIEAMLKKDFDINHCTIQCGYNTKSHL